MFQYVNILACAAATFLWRHLAPGAPGRRYRMSCTRYMVSGNGCLEPAWNRLPRSWSQVSGIDSGTWCQVHGTSKKVSCTLYLMPGRIVPGIS